MKKNSGFTFVELVIFIVIMSILALSILLPISKTLKSTETIKSHMTALATATGCMEWILGQRKNYGFSNTIFTCPNTNTPNICTNITPTGYTVSTNINCTTINSDNNYRTITVTVSGAGQSQLSSVVANY